MTGYEVVLAIHNVVRWIVLIFGIVAVVRAFLGWLGNRQWSEGDRKWGSFFAMSVDTQLLLGLLLYFFFSNITRPALRNLGAAMGNATTRFFTLEHAFYMILAVVLVHLGTILPRRATTSAAKFKSAAIWLGLALLLILIGMPWGRPLFPGLG